MYLELFIKSLFSPRLLKVTPTQNLLGVEMAVHKNPREISFQFYIDALKDQKIPWNTFVQFIEEFFFSDIEKLKYLNAMILKELTLSYSDRER